MKPLGGACYSVFHDAGGGTLGDSAGGVCDEFDGKPNDGTVKIGGLLADDYVLVQDRALAGKKLAANVLVTIGAGATKTVTVKNVSGGAVVTAVAWDDDHDDTPILDVCWVIYHRLADSSVGSYVAGYCDVFDDSTAEPRSPAFQSAVTTSWRPTCRRATLSPISKGSTSLPPSTPMT